MTGNDATSCNRPAPIKVLLVDDSPIVLHILRQLLQRAPDIQVVGVAGDGQQALASLPALQPDVICTDLHMPVIDGLALTRAVMASRPCPILVVSVSVEPNSLNVFQLLEAGAVDVYPKPRNILEADQERLAKELASKIRIVAGVHVFRLANKAAPKVVSPSVMSLKLARNVEPRMIVIGASTGGPQALHTLLSELPASFALPIVCVQHIGNDFLTELVRRLGEVCSLPVRKAAHGEQPRSGVVYFAPENAQLEFDATGRFVSAKTAAYDGHRPSATVTFKAAAKCFGAATIGVLLTGMGRDGAEGMADIAAAGGITIAQNEASCVVYGMPQAAVTLGAVRHPLPLEHIAPALVSLIHGCTESNPILIAQQTP